MKNYNNKPNNENNTTVCICDDSGVHYPCPICGKHHNDELEAELCCIDSVFNNKKE